MDFAIMATHLDMVKRVAFNMDITNVEAARIIESYCGEIIRGLTQGDNINTPLGQFYVASRQASFYRHPVTGIIMPKPAVNYAKVRFLPAIKTALN